MADRTYQPKVYRDKGGDRLVIASGGELLFEDMPTYYVDRDAGSASGDGLSYANAMNQVSLAVTAGKTWQATRANIYSRYRILVFGCSTFYTALTELPNYADIIGIGANPRGNGTGVPQIGDALTTGTTDGAAGSSRGTYWKNIQFGCNTTLGQTGNWCFDATSLFRSTFEDCVFNQGSDNNGANGTNAGALRISTAGGGNTWRRCAFGGDSNCRGFGLWAPAPFNMNLIEDCQIGGETACVYIHTASVTTGTIFRNNNIGTGLGAAITAAIGVDDNGDGFARYDNNYVFAVDAFSMTNGAYRMLGNHVVNTDTGAVELVAT